ncbi:hypothetical protein CWE23_03675 [Idiomarina aquatica]|uniref:Uncharacterized protein n=1 Tax=Idiomarina aquatica TaxID=1327752 RepID=A0AA94EGW9_9GAMM|nr:hypothetical protein CWE23_03675 [Idiomarina aquatica]
MAEGRAQTASAPARQASNAPSRAATSKRSAQRERSEYVVTFLSYAEPSGKLIYRYGFAGML